MPIPFRCRACDRRLSIATRKAGTDIACPNCRAALVVPGGVAPPDAPAGAEPPGNLRPLAVTVCLVLAVFGGLGVTLALTVGKPTAPTADQARAEPPALSASAHVSPPPQPQPADTAPPADQPADQPVAPPLPRPERQQPPAPEPSGQTVTPPLQPVTPPTPQAQPQPPAALPPAKPPRLDVFGNPVGPTVGLGKDGEFKGKKILFWCAYENADRVFFPPTSPLWKALEAKGFAVRPAFGKFNPALLKDADQLWIVSSGRFEIPAFLTPADLVAAVGLLPADQVPSGFTVPEYQFVVGATLDVALSPRHAPDAKAYAAIEEFVAAGKGLCLLADDEPFTAEADELARRLFGARVSGNYVADKVAAVRGRGLTPAEVRKFGGQFEVDDHALLTGVNFLFEGITVSNVSKSDKLAVAMTASDGRTLLAVSKVAGWRVVIDCGFTRYCHGPTPRTSYITKTPGTVRLAQNIAAYLAGKDSK